MSKKIDKKGDLILQAAIELFGKNGYEATSIIDIAKKSALGVGTVYNAYKSKEALYQECVYCVIQNVINVILDECKRVEGLKEKLLKVALIRFEHWNKYRDSLYELMTNTPLLTQKIRSSIMNPHKELQEFLSKLFATLDGDEYTFKSKDYDFLAVIFISTLDSLLHGWIHLGIDIEKEYSNRAELLVDHFLNGTTTKGGN